MMLVCLAAPALAVKCGDVNYVNVTDPVLDKQFNSATWQVDWQTCGVNESVIGAYLETDAIDGTLTNYSMTGTRPFDYTGTIGKSGTVTWRYIALTPPGSNQTAYRTDSVSQQVSGFQDNPVGGVLPVLLAVVLIAVLAGPFLMSKGGIANAFPSIQAFLMWMIGVIVIASMIGVLLV